MITKETLATRFAERLGNGWHTDELAQMVIDAITDDIDGLLMTPERASGQHIVYKFAPVMAVTAEFVARGDRPHSHIINRAKWIQP